MSDYNDLFIRDSIDETGNTLPREDVKAASPDIIPWGTSTAKNPGKLFSGDYDEDPGKAIVYNAKNYIYLRAKNYADELASGTFYLYYAYQTQLSQPNLWKPLSTAAGNNTSAAAAEAGKIAVTGDPFVWTPGQASTNPYVLIAVAATVENPNPVLGYSGTPDFKEWDASQGGVSARVIAVAPPPTPQTDYSFGGMVILKNQEALNIQVSLVPTNGVAGDEVAFSFDKSGETGPISIGASALSGSPGQTFSVNATVPADYRSAFTCTYSSANKDTIPFPTLALTIYSVTNTGGGGHQGATPTLHALVTYTLTATSRTP